MTRSIPAFAHRDFLSYVSAHAAKGDEEARRLMAKITTRHVKKVRGPDRKAQRREERRTHRASVRAVIMERAGGRCEWCGARTVLEMAHVFGGGERGSRESVETCAATCATCHRGGWHKGEMQTFLNAYAWTLRHGFKEAAHEIEHRMDLAEQSRAATGARR